MKSLFALLGIVSFFTSIIYTLILKIRKKKIRNGAILFLISIGLFVLSFTLFQNDTKSSDFNIKDLEYGELIESRLKEIGVEKVTEVYPPYVGDNGDIDITISVGDFDYDNTIVVKVVENGDAHIVKEVRGKHTSTIYYVDDSYRYDDEGNEKYDIYDYKTNEKIVKAYNKPLTDEERQRLEQKNSEREQELINTSKTILDEIGNAFKSNSISASEKYQDKEYYITATVDSVDTTITGKPRITVYQSDYKVQCVFNEGMLDKVKEVNTGDEITFYGTLDGWGVSADFTHCYFR